MAFLLLTGIALGPHGINLLSPTTLVPLDPAIPVALAALGALAGLAVGDRRTDGWRMAAAAGINAMVTMMVVSTGIAVIALVALPSVVPGVWSLAVACGICAASSLTLPTWQSSGTANNGDAGQRAECPRSDRSRWIRAGGRSH